ncbi:unnamed protein product [Penicillium discolor]
MSERPAAPASQTLSRGIRILEVLADARGALTIDDIAGRLEVHRSIAYRLLRTLEDHGLVTRDASGAVSLGARMAALAAGCITLASVEPRHAVASVAQRPGARHSVTVGAPGKAILAQLDGAEAPVAISPALRADVDAAAARGYATSHDEVIPTVQSVAVPLRLRGQRPAAIAVVHVATDLDDGEIAARLRRSADLIREALEG